ncbi:hypothetical protein MPER_13014 [Moniliophthora perniciosa FA553]|nr:hypothetical protein MPER_13014 [Moniliophthora perniciosa FA553]
MYSTIIAVTFMPMPLFRLESGLLYSAFLNVLLIIGMVYTFGVDIDGASVTGLVSTPIIIRVTLGISDEMENTVIMFRATHVENEDAAVIDISRPPADLEQKGTSERPNTPELESDGNSSSSGNTNRVD